MSYQFNLTDDDKKTIVFALSTSKNFNFELSLQQEVINNEYRLAVINKLSNNQTNFTANEIRIISASIEICKLVASKDINANKKLQKECSKHYFTLNKLAPQFSQILPAHYFD